LRWDRRPAPRAAGETTRRADSDEEDMTCAPSRILHRAGAGGRTAQANEIDT